MKSLAYATVLALALAPSYGLAQAPPAMSDADLIKLADPPRRGRRQRRDSRCDGC